MEKLKSVNLLPLVLIFIQVLWSWDDQVAAASESSTVINHLPGFQGPLPFRLETGYIGVGEEVELFYYFVKSERNPEDDPLLLWLTGGPGCSALSGLSFEIGPLRFEVLEYNGSLPTLILNPNSWTKVSSVIFVDLPVGTGFSYTTNPSTTTHQSSDTLQVSQAEKFLRKWLRNHPEFLSNPLYISGDSYSGITIPALVQQLSIGNEQGIEPMLNLKGYTIGNPSLEESCGGEYQRVSPDNMECRNNLNAFRECLSGIQPGSILDPICIYGSLNPMEMGVRRRILQDESQLSLDPPKFGCSSQLYSHLLCKYWANDEQVRKALHIREGTIVDWVRCNYGMSYESDIKCSFNYHVYLSTKGYRSLIYSGDHDLVVPFMGTQAWIRALNYSIVEDWRSWHVGGQVAGYTRTYSNEMTYATIKGGMHTAPENKPAECYAMFRRYIGVGEAEEEVELFYYFVKSETNPEEDPLLLWLTGGPGCSALSGLATENGPFTFKELEYKYNGKLPTLLLKPNSWTKISSIIYVDLPVGTGFSYATNISSIRSTDHLQVSHADQFLRKWLREHKEFLKNPLYIAGDSYAGITIPAIVQRLSIGNEQGIEPMLNLKGYILGNPTTDVGLQINSRIPAAHGMTLISDELYQALQESCRGEYFKVDSTNLECKSNLKSYFECLSGINMPSILEPACWFTSPNPIMENVGDFDKGRRMILQHHYHDSQLSLPTDPSMSGCKSHPRSLLCKYWANDDTVRKALHIRRGTIGEWVRCNYGLEYQRDITSSVEYHLHLSTKGYRSLIYKFVEIMTFWYQSWQHKLGFELSTIRLLKTGVLGVFKAKLQGTF
ncbi:Serine carboxypeptidase-like 18 [Linum grandiflorum]